MRERLEALREGGWITGWVPIVAWGAAIVAFAVCGAVFAGLDVLPTLLSASAGVGSIAWGLESAWSGRRRRRLERQARPEVVLDLSLPTVVVTFGFTVAMAGVAAAGPAFFWPGVAILGLGLLALLRESYARRELQAHARRDAGPPPEAAAPSTTREAGR